MSFSSEENLKNMLENLQVLFSDKNDTVHMHEYDYVEKIMGTTLSVAIVTNNHTLADTQFEQTLNNLKRADGQFSRFDENSELSALNATGSMRVTPSFLEVLKLGIELHEKTRGIVNPLFQIERLGYTQTFDRIKDSHQHATHTPYNTDIREIVINESTNIVTLGEGQKLDVGGFLKGHLAEIEAKRIKASSPHIQGVIVNIGGDLYASGTDERNEHFVCQIENPVTHGYIEVSLHNESLATSGTYARTWIANGKRTHHILDESGVKNPDTATISASVIHERGAFADAYAKVFLMHGLASTPKNLRGIFITRKGVLHNHL